MDSPISLYHDYLHDMAMKTDRPENMAEPPKPSQPIPIFGPLTPCFEEIAVECRHRHIDDDFATYLRHALRHLRGERHQDDYKHQDHELHELAEEDIVAASIKICMLETETSAELRFEEREEEDALIALLVPCADGDMAEVKALNGALEAVSGISALATPLLLQILVAVAFSHHNNKLVSDLIAWSPPPRRNLFNLKPEAEGTYKTWLWSHWLHSGRTGEKPLGAWEALLRAEWVAPCGEMMEFVYRAQNTAEGAAHAIYIFDRVFQSKAGLPGSTLSTIEQTVKMGPSAVVAHMLARLPHRKIKPRPHFLLTDAAGRVTVDRRAGMIPFGAEMLEVLRPMDLDVNSIIDPRGKAKGVSPLAETPLHAATYQGNIEGVRWCLKNGSRPTKDWYGKYQWEKVKDKDKEQILALYKSEGWEIDNEAWLLESKQANAEVRDEGGRFCGLRLC
ncbi:hypothetical protein F4859DRAFT_508546 [Xylaria cf. heliscus]|nr:hypothetical protein F4859DRAFT_508546 [Xylaria cf. heliscus]